MTSKRSSSLSWMGLCIGMLCACGSEDETPACGPQDSCTAQPSAVEAGVATDAASGAGNGSVTADAGGLSGNGSDAAVSTSPKDAGQVSSVDAGQSARDAGPAMPSGDAGAPVDNGPTKPSAGCGMAAPPGGNSTIDINGTMREYILTLPTGYDPMKPYKLIFAWHGLGGTAASVAGSYYGLKTRSANSAIFVSGQGLPTSGTASGAGAGGAGWANSGGVDVAFVKALYARLQGQICFDENRVFSTGMSYGGIMSNTLGCSMGDVFRAIAPMAGQGPGFGGRATCVGQVAVWASHGDNDTVVSTANGEASRDFWAKANHCQATTAPVEPSPCVAYAGCDMGHPVTWCKFPGGHTIPPFASAAIWTFFSQF